MTDKVYFILPVMMVLLFLVYRRILILINKRNVYKGKVKNINLDFQSIEMLRNDNDYSRNDIYEISVNFTLNGDVKTCFIKDQFDSLPNVDDIVLVYYDKNKPFNKILPNNYKIRYSFEIFIYTTILLCLLFYILKIIRT